MDSVGAERMREAREGLLQMSRMDKWVAWPRAMVVEMEGEGVVGPGCTEEEDLARLGYLALGSKGGRSSHDSKFLGWTDGRMVVPFAELSWGLGRFGGGEVRGFRFAHVEGEGAGGEASEDGL